MSILDKIKEAFSKVNWNIRFTNINFYYSFVPGCILVIVSVFAIFGIELDLTEMGDKILNAIKAILALLAILGIINDPTTAGYADSKQALSYIAPRNDSEEAEKTECSEE